MADRKLNIEITVDDSGAISKLRDLETVGDKVAVKHSKHGSVVNALKGSYTELNSKIGFLKTLYNDISAAIEAPIAAAKKEIAVNVELVAALKVRGQNTEANIASLVKQQGAVSLATAMDDEAVASIQKYGLALGKITLEQIPDYTQAVIGYSELTGKAWEVSAKTIAAYLSGATPKIKGLNLELEKGASATEKLGALLVATQPGWQASIDKANTFEGAQKKLNNAWGNFLESIGAYITTSDAVSGAISTLAGWMQELADKMKDNPGMIDDMVQGFQDFVSNTPELITALQTIGDALTILAKPLEWTLNAIASINQNPIDSSGTSQGGAGYYGEAEIPYIGQGMPAAEGSWSYGGSATSNNSFSYEEQVEMAAMGGNEGQSYSLAEIQQMTDDDIERNFSSAKSSSRLRQRGQRRSIVNAGTPQSARAISASVSSSRGTSIVYIGNVDELARAIAGYSNLQLAEAGNG